MEEYSGYSAQIKILTSQPQDSLIEPQYPSFAYTSEPHGWELHD